MNLTLMRLIAEQFLATHYYGSRQMARWYSARGITAPSVLQDNFTGSAERVFCSLDLSSDGFDQILPTRTPHNALFNSPLSTVYRYQFLQSALGRSDRYRVTGIGHQEIDGLGNKAPASVRHADGQKGRLQQSAKARHTRSDRRSRRINLSNTFSLST